jgi:hypothetical protein
LAALPPKQHACIELASKTMIEFSKYFDEYSFNARVKPAFFLIFPVFVSLLVLFEPLQTWTGSAVTLLVAFGVVDFAANQMSAKGNKLQQELFERWGGAPTTIILRHSDNTIDSVTKSRYMERLAFLISNFTPTTVECERYNPGKADALYMSASNYLREHTRDVKEYPLIFKENIAYGFSRNLRAFKSLGVFIAVSSLLVSSLAIYLDAPNLSAMSYREVVQGIPFTHYGLVIIHLSIIGVWVFLVTKEWVKIRAFAYAKRLYAACEKMAVV